MPYQLDWLVPKRIVLLTYQGTITETELHESDAALCRFYDEGDANAAHIHQICILDGSSKTSLAQLTALKWPKHPRNGWMIGIGKTNSIERIIGGFAAQLLKMRFRSADTVEEAVEILYRVDLTLPEATRPTASTRD